MQDLFDKLGYDTSRFAPLHVDNKSAIQVAKNPDGTPVEHAEQTAVGRLACPRG
jgi:hypothetical protein